MPRFVEAASKSAVWDAHLNAIERGLEFFSQDGDAASIELFDKLSAIIHDESRELKPRLLDIVSAISEFLHGKHGRN